MHASASRSLLCGGPFSLFLIQDLQDMSRIRRASSMSPLHNGDLVHLHPLSADGYQLPHVTAKDQTTYHRAPAFVHGIESFAQAALLGNRDDEAHCSRYVGSVYFRANEAERGRDHLLKQVDVFRMRPLAHWTITMPQ